MLPSCTDEVHIGRPQRRAAQRGIAPDRVFDLATGSPPRRLMILPCMNLSGEDGRVQRRVMNECLMHGGVHGPCRAVSLC